MSPSQVTIRTILYAAAQTLEQGSDSPRLDAELLLAHILGRNRSYLYSHPETLLDSEQIDQYDGLLRRRHRGEPLAYLIGSKEFWSLPLSVNQHVLVPRAETELLIDVALACFPPERSIRAVDLGTGSGALAVALSHERPHWQLVATDISKSALKTARSNAHALALRNIHFLSGNWFTPLKNLSFELIICNPPYIDSCDPHLNQPELGYEPRQALVSKDHGLGNIKHIVKKAPLHLVRDGFLIIEHGYNQGASVRNLLEQRGFSAVSSHLDLSGHERASMAQWS
jgi:release factor glutamine methyltransferase